MTFGSTDKISYILLATIDSSKFYKIVYFSTWLCIMLHHAES